MPVTKASGGRGLFLDDTGALALMTCPPLSSPGANIPFDVSTSVGAGWPSFYWVKPPFSLVSLGDG